MNDFQDIKINLRAVKRCNFLLSMHISNEKLINSNLNDLHTRKTEDQDSSTKGACQFIPRQNYKIVIKCRVVVLCIQSVFYKNVCMCVDEDEQVLRSSFIMICA